MDQNISARLDVLEQKVDAIYKSVERTRNYFLATLIISVIFFVVPLIGLLVMVPILLNTLSSAYSGLY